MQQPMQQQPMQQQSPIADHLHWRVRNQSYITALGLGLVGIAAFAGGAVARSLPVKAAMFGVGAIAPIVAGARFRHDYKQSELMGAIEESAFIQGYRESQVKLFAPIDAQRQMGQQQQQQQTESTSVQDEDPEVALFQGILELGAPLSAILLGLIQLGVDVTADSVVKAAENDRGKGWVISVSKPSAVVRLAADLMAVAKLPVEPIISVVSGGIAVILPNPVVEADADIAGPSIAIPVTDKVAVESDAPMEVSDRLPDGARLIEMAALNNIDRYPVVMVVAGQGSGKTATMAAILSVLDGYKTVASPKPVSGAMQAIADLIFGFDPTAKRWRYFGDPFTEDFSDDQDLSKLLSTGQKLAGSMLGYCHATAQESANRQLNPQSDRTPWRCFFDECADTYLMGFSDKLLPPKQNKDRVAMGQQVVSDTNRNSLVNWRGQKLQHFIGTQVKTVATIGLEGFAAARDEAWWLFPGLAAITEAKSLGKYQLANWMQRRVESGYGVALLNKQDSLFEVINLPDIDTLSKFSKD